MSINFPTVCCQIAVLLKLWLIDEISSFKNRHKHEHPLVVALRIRSFALRIITDVYVIASGIISSVLPLVHSALTCTPLSLMSKSISRSRVSIDTGSWGYGVEQVSPGDSCLNWETTAGEN